MSIMKKPCNLIDKWTHIKYEKPHLVQNTKNIYIYIRIHINPLKISRIVV